MEFDIVVIRYKEDFEVSLDQAVEDYLAYDEFTQGERVKKLIISGKTTSMSKEARQFIQKANRLRKDKIVAEAIVIHSQAQKVLGNIYLSFLKSQYPIKLFKNEEEATKWLKDI